MASSTNQTPENSSHWISTGYGSAATAVATTPTTTTTTPKTDFPLQKCHLTAFDLTNVGLSSTFAIAVFIGIGYVVKHVAGPSAIISVVIAAFIAYLVGAFYTELNATIVLSANKSSSTSKRLSQVTVATTIDMANNCHRHNPSISTAHLLSSARIAYICNGKLAAFIVAWNLIMEYIVIVALISKALIIYIDALIYGSVGHLTQIVTMVWPFGQYFDVLAMLVPIAIGVPLLVVLRRNTIFNGISIVLSMVVVAIFLIVGIFNGGFCAYGIDGIFRGAILILFAFIAFDAMIMSPTFEYAWILPASTYSQSFIASNYPQSINRSIIAINTTIFICLLGMAFALTTIQPVYLMDENIPLLSVINVAFNENDIIRFTMHFIILIAGCIALIGSLYAVLHAELRVIQMMLSIDADDSTFKLFGKFGLSHLQQELWQQFDEPCVHTNRSNNTNGTNGINNINQLTQAEQQQQQQQPQQKQKQQRQWRTCAYLLFSILSGLLAGLFATEHLINLLSIGTLFMLFALTIDIMILRHSAELKQRLNLQFTNGKPFTKRTKSTRSISLLAILLAIYCLLAIILTIYIKLVTEQVIAVSTIAFWLVNGILIAGLLAILFLLGVQPKGNAMFSLSVTHPILPAIVLFACVYLCTAIDVTAWVRLGVWMGIGIIFYILLTTFEERPKAPADYTIPNRDTHQTTISETKTTASQPWNDRISTEQVQKSHDNSSLYNENIDIRAKRPSDSNTSNEIVLNVTEIQSFTSQSNDTKSEIVVIELEQMHTNPAESIETTQQIVAETERKPPPRGYFDQSKLNEISSIDDIKHAFIECREPNGTTYFVEADSVNSDAESVNQSIDIEYIDQLTPEINELGEIEKIEMEKNLMERLLKQTNIEMKPASIPIVIEPVESPVSDEDIFAVEQDVRAIIHATNDHQMQYDTPSIHSQNSQTFDSPAKDMPNFQIGVYEAIPKQKLLYENDQSRRAFKLRLENLFSQNDEIAVQNRTKSHFSSPIAKHSQRLSLNHSMSAPESLDIPINGSVGLASVQPPVSHDGDKSPSIIATYSEIPSAPVFDQQLYNTIGRAKRKEFASVSEVIGINGTQNDKRSESVPKANLSRAKAHENLSALNADDETGDDNDITMNIANIRQKLENIFSQGRTTQASSSALEQNNNENVQRSKRYEPFDTVRRQKMRFSNVLKSIGPDPHANLHPTQTTAAIDIQETQRRESLN